MALNLVSSLIIAVIMHYVMDYISPLNSFLLCALLIISLHLIYGIPLNTAVVASVFSIGLCYGLCIVSLILLTPIVLLLIGILGTNNTAIFDIISFSLEGIIQLLLAALLFKFKRLKNGMPFLKEQGASDIGMFISASILLATSLIGDSIKNDIVFAALLFFTLFCGMGLFFWWKSRITKNYLERLKANEIAKLESSIQEKEVEIQSLKSNNEELSKIIHKDNKLIPAMELAVREMLSTSDSDKAAGLLSQLEALSSERSGIVKKYETANQVLPSTDVSSIDAVIRLMLHRAHELDISFELSLTGSVLYMVKNIISENDLNTLIADLLENALIATKKQQIRNVLLSVGIEDNKYFIHIFDSGVLFETKTLLELGKKRSTTHINEGGSGIGLMTTAELLQKYNASFEIKEIEDNDLYTKQVSICFDNLHEYRIKSNRKEVLNLPNIREDIIIIK